MKTTTLENQVKALENKANKAKDNYYSGKDLKGYDKYECLMRSVSLIEKAIHYIELAESK